MDADYDYLEESREECCPTEMPCVIAGCDGVVQVKVSCYHYRGDRENPPDNGWEITVRNNDCGCVVDSEYVAVCQEQYAQ